MSGFELSAELAALREEAVRFATARLTPAARESERAGRWPREILDVLDGFGLREIDLPERLGGVGAGSLAKVVLLEALAAGDAGGLPAADASGPSTGALVACPDASLAGRVASAAAVLVVVDAEAPRAPRIEWAPSWPTPRFAWVSTADELRLLELATPPEPARALAFQASGGVACEITRARALGEWDLAPGAGLGLRGRARLWCAAVALGVAQSAFDATVSYTQERIVFGKPVAHHQGNAFELAGAAANLHGARLLVRDAADAFDRGDAHAGFWATQSWIGAVEVAVAITDLGIQLLGGHGFVVDHLAEKRFREARMLGLLAGGRDAADADLAACVLDVPDALGAAR